MWGEQIEVEREVLALLGVTVEEMAEVVDVYPTEVPARLRWKFWNQVHIIDQLNLCHQMGTRILQLLRRDRK